MTSLRSGGGRLRARSGAGLLLMLPLLFWTPGLHAAAAEPTGTGGRLRLAVLPADDLSEGHADLRAVDLAVSSRVGLAGFEIVPSDDLLAFMRRHRMRNTGGVRLELLAAMREELRADAVLVCSVDQFVVEPTPRVALNARLIEARAGRIVWANEVSLAGEQRPGLLGLGEIHEVGEVLERTADALIDGLSERQVRQLSGTTATWGHPGAGKRYRPRKSFRSSALGEEPSRTTRVAVLPFENRSERLDAGGAIAGLLATHLAGREQIDLLEPGEVRHMLLQGRVIQLSGLSLAQADFLREMLDVDLVVTGEILQLADRGRTAAPEVAFSIWVIDAHRREVVWSGYSSNRGDDGVVFFQIGRAITARELLSRMVREVANEIARAIPAAAPVTAPDGAR